MQTYRNLKRRSQIGYGVFVLGLVSLMVTGAVHQVSPSASSPLLWAILTLAMVAGFVEGLWCDREAERVRT